jgi:sialate O-acetylesterase
MSRRIVHGRLLSLAALIATLAFVSPAPADVRLPHVLSDHMVLQRDRPVPVWGWADPNESVTVTFAGQNLNTKADAAGHWQVQLQPLSVNAKPQVMTVKGHNTLTVQDILVGEVWLCSGQSNMAFALRSASNAADAIAKAKYPLIRLLNAPRTIAAEPRHDLTMRWELCQPHTAPTFSAVGYFFGRDLFEKLNVPIGLIESDWGGTRIQAWTPQVGLEAVPQLKGDLQWIHTQQAKYQQMKKSLIPAVAAWLSEAQAAEKQNQPIPDPPAWPGHPIASSQQNPTALYNGMIAPIVPFALRGTIWYQGEANVAEGSFYLERLQGLIQGLRTVLKNPDMPFGIVELAPYAYGGDRENLPKLWEAQSDAARKIPHVGVAVITDHGNLHNIHPTEKEPTGHRLALWALATVYDQKGLAYRGPVFDKMEIQNASARLRFTQTAGGLVSSDGKPLSGWSIAGADKQFVPAAATIDGDSVVVHSDKVPHPAAVRYGWDPQTPMNFANKAGLPAEPFRTDHP